MILSAESEINSLLINNGTLDMNGKKLSIRSDFQNNGSIKSNGAALHFVGQNIQKISGKGNFGTKAEPLNGVFFDNSKNIKLEADAIYLKNAFLQKGKIINSQKLFFDKNALVSIGGNDGKSDAGSFDQSPNYEADISLTILYQNQAKKATMSFEIPSNKQLDRLIIANEKGVALVNNLQINQQLDLQNGVLSIDVLI